MCGVNLRAKLNAFHSLRVFIRNNLTKAKAKLNKMFLCANFFCIFANKKFYLNFNLLIFSRLSVWVFLCLGVFVRWSIALPAADLLPADFADCREICGKRKRQAVVNALTFATAPP